MKWAGRSAISCLQNFTIPSCEHQDIKTSSSLLPQFDDFSLEPKMFEMVLMTQTPFAGLSATQEEEPALELAHLVMEFVVSVIRQELWHWKQAVSLYYFLVNLNCGQMSSENCTYFQSSTTVAAGQCAVTICPCNSNICQVQKSTNNQILIVLIFFCLPSCD